MKWVLSLVWTPLKKSPYSLLPKVYESSLSAQWHNESTLKAVWRMSPIPAEGNTSWKWTIRQRNSSGTYRGLLRFFYRCTKWKENLWQKRRKLWISKFKWPRPRTLSETFLRWFVTPEKSTGGAVPIKENFYYLNRRPSSKFPFLTNWFSFCFVYVNLSHWWFREDETGLYDFE